MEPSFLRKYVFSVDHKWIAKQYMITGLVMAVAWRLTWPTFFAPNLPGPENPYAGFGPVGENVYNALVTMHGTIMVFWVAMPILLAGFGNFLIPLMIGADDMAFPRLNMVSYLDVPHRASPWSSSRRSSCPAGPRPWAGPFIRRSRPGPSLPAVIWGDVTCGSSRVALEFVAFDADGWDQLP